MTALALEFDALDAVDAPQRRLVAVRGSVDAPRRAGSRTLDASLTDAWALVTAGRIAACPVCAGPLSPRLSAAGAAGAHCGGCGSSLD